MTLSVLTSRILLAQWGVAGLMVCCRETGASADMDASDATQPLAMIDPGTEPADPPGPCHRRSVPGPSHTPASDREHAPGFCPDCPGSVLLADNVLGTPAVGSSSTFPDTLSFAGPMRSVGRSDPPPQRLGMVAKPQAAFGGESLLALSRLLTI